MTSKTFFLPRIVAALAVLVLGSLASSTHAGEGTKSDIAPETREVVLDTIEDYVRHDIAVKEAFLVVDPRTGEPLRLTLDHVHQGVKPRGERYLACVDFQDDAGTIHDVDVVVDLDAERPRVIDVYLHKVDGETVAAEDRP